MGKYTFSTPSFLISESRKAVRGERGGLGMEVGGG